MAATIRSRALPEGGFALTGCNDFRVDATAWAVAALSAVSPEDPLLPAARTRLAANQTPEGCVPILPEASDAIWPTPLAVFAWLAAPGFAGNVRSAAAFLLKTEGHRFPLPENAPFSHDTNLQGWPWNLKTSSWVEPTALAVLALQAAGHGAHPRVAEGRRLLLNRQIPSGGWNYGNVTVYGQELHPNPECTGLALAALSGACAVDGIAASLGWLEERTQALDTPLALSWSLLGLSAWGMRPAGTWELVSRCLDRQVRLGPYETWHFALLLLAGLAKEGLAKHLAARAGEAADGQA